MKVIIRLKCNYILIVSLHHKLKYFSSFRRNPTSSQTLLINNANSITSSNFNARVPTVVIVHGWLSNQNTDINPVIRDGKFVNNVPWLPKLEIDRLLPYCIVYMVEIEIGW